MAPEGMPLLLKEMAVPEIKELRQVCRRIILDTVSVQELVARSATRDKVGNVLDPILVLSVPGYRLGDNVINRGIQP